MFTAPAETWRDLFNSRFFYETAELPPANISFSACSDCFVWVEAEFIDDDGLTTYSRLWRMHKRLADRVLK